VQASGLCGPIPLPLQAVVTTSFGSSGGNTHTMGRSDAHPNALGSLGINAHSLADH
jgi:hypothetical protein